MIIERRSIMSGEWNEMDLPITAEQFQRYENGEGKVQDIFPDLPAELREFIMSGITPDEWKKNFGS